MGDCKAAFAGGSSLIVNPNTWVLLGTMGLKSQPSIRDLLCFTSSGVSAFSPDDKFCSYDHKANGLGAAKEALALRSSRSSSDPLYISSLGSNLE